MKQFVYLILIFLIVGCAKNASKNFEATDISEDNFMTKEESTPIVLEDSYALLISEKLQDYLDKQQLADKHPAFIPEKDTTSLFSIKKVREIQEVKLIGQPEILSDSVTKIITEVRFSSSQTDTIISYITTSKTLIEGVEFKTSKTTFERLKSSKINK